MFSNVKKTEIYLFIYYLINGLKKKTEEVLDVFTENIIGHFNLIYKE